MHQYFDFQTIKEFKIYTDASNAAIGAVLAQQIDGKEVVIAYASKTSMLLSKIILLLNWNV